MRNIFRKSSDNTQDKVQEALKNGALIIDVRSPQEFAAGHTKGSENIPLDQVEEKMEEIRKQNRGIQRRIMVRPFENNHNFKQLIPCKILTGTNTGKPFTAQSNPGRQAGMNRCRQHL